MMVETGSSSDTLRIARGADSKTSVASIVIKPAGTSSRSAGSSSWLLSGVSIHSTMSGRFQGTSARRDECARPDAPNPSTPR